MFSFNHSSRIGPIIKPIKGELYRLISLSQGRSLVWKRSGDQGNMWVKAEVSLTATSDPNTYPYRVEFEGIVGSGYRSDIAVDDINLRSGACDTKG